MAGNKLTLSIDNGGGETGDVVINLRPDLAPGHVERITELAGEGFYDGVKFHRVIEGFMAQGGCPNGTGMGGSDKPDLKAEFNSEPHTRGTCSMARTQVPDSANSQFFICFGDAEFLDGQYTVWGQGGERHGSGRCHATWRATRGSGGDHQSNGWLIMRAGQQWLRPALVVGLGLLTSACATDLTQARSPCLFEPGGWCGFTRQMAAQSWEYAQLANDTYNDKDEFDVLPSGIRERHNSGNDDKGYAYAVYDRIDGDGHLTETIIAFRGTERSLQDWVSGNFGNAHNERGRATYRIVREQLDAAGYQSVPVAVTGHSLGGAISAHIAFREAGVSSYAFNQSPRFTIPDNRPPARKDVRRMSVAERGEALRLLRNFKQDNPQEMLVINCRPRGAPWKDHSIRKLSECLTWIAAYESKAALRSVKNNKIIKPAVECGAGDEKHPNTSAASKNDQQVACYHKPKIED